MLQLEVTDVDRSGRWYRRVLGMRNKSSVGAEGLTLQAQGDFQIRLVAGMSARPRNFRFGLQLSNRVEVRQWRAHVDAADTYANPIVERESYYGFTVADPDGYLLEFQTDAPEAEA